eukprot:953739-Prymnesium_polylepis.1
MAPPPHLDPGTSALEDDDDEVALTYFEVYEYSEPELDLLIASLDMASTVDSDSTSYSLGLDEQTLDDDPCALWPTLKYDRASARDSNLSEASTHFEPCSPEESAAALLAEKDGAACLAQGSAALCERERNRRGSVSSDGDQLSMNQLLARRAIAAT